MSYLKNKKKLQLKTVFTAPLLLSLVTLLPINTALAESLSDALRSVHGGNAKLEAERAKQRGESEKTNQARAGFLPSVYLQADNSILVDRNLRSGSTSRTEPRSIGLGFSQPIFNGFRTMGDYQRAQDEVLASQSNLLNAQQTTLLYGAQAYMRVLRDRQVLALRRENLNNLNQQQMQANARFKAGDMTLTGVDQTKARVAEAEADLAQTQADLADSESYYRYMIGRAPGALRMPALHRVTLPCSVQDAVLVAESDNPNLQSAYHLERAADGSIKSAKAAFYPSFSFEGSLRRGYDDSKISGAQVDDATVGVKMSLPLYSGGIDKSRLKAAEEAKTQRTFELNDTRNNTRRMVTSSFDALRSAKLRKTASIKRVSANNAALYGLTVEFKAGQIPLINLLDGRREAANSRVNLAVSEFDEGMNIFNLLASIGHLDMAMVEAMSQGQSVNTSSMCHKNAPVGSIKRSLPAAELAKLAPTPEPLEPKPAPLKEKPIAAKEVIEPEIISLIDEPTAIEVKPKAEIITTKTKLVEVKKVEVKAEVKKEVEPEVISLTQEEPPVAVKPQAEKTLPKLKTAEVKKTTEPKNTEPKIVQPHDIVSLEVIEEIPATKITVAKTTTIIPGVNKPNVKAVASTAPLPLYENQNLDKPRYRPGALAYFKGLMDTKDVNAKDAELKLISEQPVEQTATFAPKAKVIDKPLKINHLSNIKASAPLSLIDE